MRRASGMRDRSRVAAAVSACSHVPSARARRSDRTVGGNVVSLRTMSRASKNPKVRFIEVKGATHFDLLAPTNELIARKILRDKGPECDLAFSGEEVSAPFGK